MPPGESEFRASGAEINEISRLAGKPHSAFAEAFFKSAKHGWNWAIETLLGMDDAESGGQKITVDMRNDFNATALMYAAQNGYHKTAELLLDKGADVNAQGQDGWTALMISVKGGWITVTALLIESGANPDATDAQGRTALHLAAFEGQTIPLRRLIEAGADPLIRDRDGKTALDLAIASNRPHVIPVLSPYTQEKLEAQKQREKEQAQARHARNIEMLDRLNPKRPPKSG